MDNGAEVIILDIDSKKIAREVSKGIFDAYVCDVSSRRDFSKVLSKICCKYGGIDILISNAGSAHESPIADVNDDDLCVMCDIFLEFNVDGVIISNTTLERPFKGFGENFKGGLSGELLYLASTNQLKRVYEYTKGQIPLIGVGGITNGNECYEKIKAGASLVQLYTALVYQGPKVIDKILKELNSLVLTDGYKNISEAVGKSS